MQRIAKLDSPIVKKVSNLSNLRCGTNYNCNKRSFLLLSLRDRHVVRDIRTLYSLFSIPQWTVPSIAVAKNRALDAVSSDKSWYKSWHGVHCCLVMLITLMMRKKIGYFAITVMHNMLNDRHCESPISSFYIPFSQVLSPANGLLEKITDFLNHEFADSTLLIRADITTGRIIVLAVRCLERKKASQLSRWKCNKPRPIFREMLLDKEYNYPIAQSWSKSPES